MPTVQNPPGLYTKLIARLSEHCPESGDCLFLPAYYLENAPFHKTNFIVLIQTQPLLHSLLLEMCVRVRRKS